MKAIRAGICVLIGFAVLSFGGVEPWGEAILEIGAAALFVLWGILAIRRQNAEIHWNWLYLPLLGLGAIAIVQCTFGLSIDPYLTKIELLKWGAYVLLVFLALQSFRTENHLKQFVWFLVILCFIVSLFGIIQHFTFNGKLYWSVTVPSGAGPFGPFVDGDHFAGFVELTTPLGLALLLFRARRREQVPLLLLFTIVPIGALILSASRGGIIGLVLEFVLLAFLSRAHQIGRKQLLGATAIALIAGTFIVWLGVSQAIERFEQLRGGGITRELRVSIYQDTWRIFLDHPWVGTGLGSLIAVYPRYASFYDGLTVDHAHNDYLELLADAGLVGGLCGLSFVGLLFWRGLANLQVAERAFARATLAGALAACAGLLVHSLVDFNLHIPSNALIFLLLACIATAGTEEPSHNRSTRFKAHSSRIAGTSLQRYESPPTFRPLF
ncbi:MAG: O-antigen ligase family protein [Candidatus Acidiferrales bacterium]